MYIVLLSTRFFGLKNKTENTKAFIDQNKFINDFSLMNWNLNGKDTCSCNAQLMHFYHGKSLFKNQPFLMTEKFKGPFICSLQRLEEHTSCCCLEVPATRPQQDKVFVAEFLLVSDILLCEFYILAGWGMFRYPVGRLLHFLSSALLGRHFNTTST